ncbi:hypothetical protein CLOM_g5794, partial [Closterium sp. NIES-68]
LATLIRKHADNFPDDLPAGLPPERDHDHNIELELGAQPTVRTQWRLTQPELDELRRQLDFLLEKGFVRPSTSPFAAPILFTPKEDGGLQMCIDYRALNRVTMKSRYPIPRADELIDQLRRAKFFSKIDLRGGYHQIRVHKDDCYKTAFRIRYGSYEYTVMPFGLTNAPSMFQLTMNEVFRPLLDNCIVVYLDDILIFNTTRELHLKDLEAVFFPMQQHRLITKGSETDWSFWDTHPHLTVKQGAYYLKSGTNRIWVPAYRMLRELLIQEAQNSNFSGHYGIGKTAKLLSRNYYWPNLPTDVQQYVTSYATCQRMKSSRLRPSGLLQPLEPPSRPWQQVTMDFVTGLPTGSSGNDAILVAVDRLTKMAYFAACKTTITAEQTAKLFLTNIMRLYGIPSAIISDRNPQFTSNLWTKTWQQYGTRLQLSTASHPQSDGQTECTNQRIEQLIRTTCTDPAQWEDSLPLIEFAYNNAPSAMAT